MSVKTLMKKRKSGEITEDVFWDIITNVPGMRRQYLELREIQRQIERKKSYSNPLVDFRAEDHPMDIYQVLHRIRRNIRSTKTMEQRILDVLRLRSSFLDRPKLRSAEDAVTRGLAWDKKRAYQHPELHTGGLTYNPVDDYQELYPVHSCSAPERGTLVNPEAGANEARYFAEYEKFLSNLPEDAARVVVESVRSDNEFTDAYAAGGTVFVYSE